MNQSSMIGTPVLRALVRSAKAGELVARGVPGGFLLVMRDGLDESVLEAQRGHARKFRRLDSLASYLRDIGVTQFVVEGEHWTPRSLTD